MQKTGGSSCGRYGLTFTQNISDEASGSMILNEIIFVFVSFDFVSPKT